MAIAQLEYPRFKAINASNKALSGGKVFVYEAGTSTKATIWQDADKNSQHSNPVTLDTNGEAEIWFEGPVKVVLEDSDGNQQWTMDDIESDIPPTDVGRFNQVENGSFEIDSDADNLPDEWTITEYDTTSTVELDSAEVAHGANSLKFVSQGAGGGTATTTDFFPVNAGQIVTVAFTIKSSVADVQNSVSVRWHDKDQTFISASTVYNENTSNPTSFEEKRFTASVPATATYAKLRLVGCDSADSTSGTTYYDDVKVYTDEQAAVHSSSDVWEFTGTGGSVSASAADINRTTNELFTGKTEPWFFSSVPNSGWLFVNGETIGDTGSGADHTGSDLEDLFNLIKGEGARFGNTGSEVFANGDTVKLPDARDRVLTGSGTMGRTDAGRVSNYTTALGDTGGEDEHQLSDAEMPSHNHGGSTGNAGSHSHTANSSAQTGAGSFFQQSDTGGTNLTTDGVGNHSHSISTNGSDSPHNNMQPFIVCNWIIKK